MEQNNLPSNPPFAIGQKVVCLKRDWSMQLYNIKCPKKDDVCIVNKCFNLCGYWFIYLEGYTALMPSGNRVDFHVIFFAPLQPTPPSISRDSPRNIKYGSSRGKKRCNEA